MFAKKLKHDIKPDTYHRKNTRSGHITHKSAVFAKKLIHRHTPLGVVCGRVTIRPSLQGAASSRKSDTKLSKVHTKRGSTDQICTQVTDTCCTTSDICREDTSCLPEGKPGGRARHFPGEFSGSKAHGVPDMFSGNRLHGSTQERDVSNDDETLPGRCSDSSRPDCAHLRDDIGCLSLDFRYVCAYGVRMNTYGVRMNTYGVGMNTYGVRMNTYGVRMNTYIQHVRAYN